MQFHFIRKVLWILCGKFHTLTFGLVKTSLDTIWYNFLRVNNFLGRTNEFLMEWKPRRFSVWMARQSSWSFMLLALTCALGSIVHFCLSATWLLCLGCLKHAATVHSLSDLFMDVDQWESKLERAPECLSGDREDGPKTVWKMAPQKHS